MRPPYNRLFDGTGWSAVGASSASTADAAAPSDVVPSQDGEECGDSQDAHETAAHSEKRRSDEQQRVQQHRALEESIIAQSSDALAEIEAEYRAGEAALLLGDPATHVERFMTALSRLTAALERIPRPVPPFSKAAVLYKVLADGWLDILMSTLQAPVTDPLYVRPMILYEFCVKSRVPSHLPQTITSHRPML